jgi:hypothetical protein
MPSIFCRTHGEQPGRTRCKWCGHDPIKHVNHPTFSSQSGVLGHTVPNGGAAPFSFPVGIQDDSYQELADVFE